VIVVPTSMLNKDEQRTSQSPRSTAATESSELRAAASRQATRVRRLRINAAAWAVGTVLLTTLWVLNQWQANGSFRHFGNEGNPGDWSPTLWALGLGVWTLVVGIMALRVHFERPATEEEIEREVERLESHLAAEDTPSTAELRRVAGRWLVQTRRLRFHVAAWVLGMVVVTPLWALIEWQDNGGFERWSANSRPGDWEPWILYAGGIWALVIAVLALRVHLDRPTRMRR
jgi:hypothetical protein